MPNFKPEECIERHLVPELSNAIRLQEYGHKIFESIPTKSALKKSIKKGLIALDGHPAKTSDWIKPGQVLEVYAEQIIHEKKVFKLKLDVLYEDDYLAVINKPSGYPTNGNYFKTIEQAMPYNLSESLQKDKLPWPKPVHRLDNPTSGLLLIAKTNTMKSSLSILFENQGVVKSYIAIVEGVLEPKKGVISETIQDKESSTAYEVSQSFEIDQHSFSLVNLHPNTGSTHQLRIHLSQQGCPIVGDADYGAKFESKTLYLHASSLSFPHPKTKKTLNFTTDMPHKFVKFRDRIQ